MSMNQLEQQRDLTVKESQSNPELDARDLDSLSDNDQRDNEIQNMQQKPPLDRPVKYSKRNYDIIKQLQEKNQRLVEDQEKQKKKEQEDRERLRREILEQAAKMREEKRKQSDHTDETIWDKKESSAKKGAKPSEIKLSKKEQEIANIYGQSLKPENGAEKERLDKFYRSRYASFLKALQETNKSKRATEELERRKKEETINKIRENMGINNITSKIFEGDAKPREKDSLEGKEQLSATKDRGRKAGPTKQDHDRCLSADNPDGRLTMEAQHKLLEKQKKMLSRIAEKKRAEQMQEEEDALKKSKLREKLKEKVLTMNKTSSIPFKSEISKITGGSATLKGLDLEASARKSRRKMKAHTSLPPIKDRNEDASDDGDNTNYDDEEPGDEKNLTTSNKTPKKRKSKKKATTKLLMYPNIHDLAAWKKKHRLDPETRVFVVIGGYPALKRALEARGWVENPDINSQCFDLKWTLKAKDISMDSLQDFQIVNHFQKNTSITTKVGLCKSLRNIIWHANVDIDTFYPRCFDMGDPNDVEDFTEEFKHLKAQSVLKKYMRAIETKDPNVQDMEPQAIVALNVCQKRMRNIDDLLDDPKGIVQNIVTSDEWEILAQDELTEEGLAKKKHEAWFTKLESNFVPRVGVAKAKKDKKKKKKKKKVVKKTDEEGKEEVEDEDEEEEEEDEPAESELTQSVRKILEAMKEKYPQFSINGENNIWIVKPAGLSRGRGIVCFKHLVEILDQVKREGQWVAQKYIENPMIVQKRKFDIRQWVLVTDWNPLTIWFYEESYVRFSAEDFDMSKLDNKLIHLTNNSVTKHAGKEEETEEIIGNMWTCQQLEDHFKETYNSDIFNEKIKPSMKQSVLWSLESVQDMIENKRNSVELYGYDFMVDEACNTWLIEINSSPAMDYSTPVTERMVKLVLEDVAKVLVDYGMSKAKKKKNIDTGLFTCLHKSKQQVDKPLTSFGLDLVLEGKSIKKK